MFPDPQSFAFVPTLEAACAEILAELSALPPDAFAPSIDSLTSVSGGYDETGWLYHDLYGGEEAERNRRACPLAARASAAVPGMRNAGFSLFRPGTHLYPHRGELPGVLRCHLPLLVPDGDLGIRFGDEVRIWEPGRCLIIDDTFEHEAWNRGASDRVVLLVTFTHTESHTTRSSSGEECRTILGTAPDRPAPRPHGPAPQAASARGPTKAK